IELIHWLMRSVAWVSTTLLAIAGIRPNPLPGGACIRIHMSELIGFFGVRSVAPGTPSSPFPGTALHMFVLLSGTSKRTSNPFHLPSGRWQKAQFACRYERARSSSVAPAGGDPDCPGY